MLPDYIASANQNTFIAVQIESVEGLENCEEIAKVEGIDCLFVGPNDLCSNMGFVAGDHPDVPEVQEAINRILKACQAAGKYAGIVSASLMSEASVLSRLFNLSLKGSWVGRPRAESV